MAERGDQRSNPRQNVGAIRRRNSACLVILSCDYTVLSSEPAFEVLLRSAGLERPARRLPQDIETAVKRILESEEASEQTCEDVVLPAAHLTVRACRLFGPDDSCVAVSIERLRVRDPLNGARERFALSPRECEVLGLMLDGLEAREIAVRLNIAQSTVTEHVKHLYLKTGARNRSSMVARVLDWPDTVS